MQISPIAHRPADDLLVQILGRRHFHGVYNRIRYEWRRLDEATQVEIVKAHTRYVAACHKVGVDVDHAGWLYDAVIDAASGQGSVDN